MEEEEDLSGASSGVAKNELVEAIDALGELKR